MSLGKKIWTAYSMQPRIILSSAYLSHVTVAVNIYLGPAILTPHCFVVSSLPYICAEPSSLPNSSSFFSPFPDSHNLSKTTGPSYQLLLNSQKSAVGMKRLQSTFYSVISILLFISPIVQLKEGRPDV